MVPVPRHYFVLSTTDGTITPPYKRDSGLLAQNYTHSQIQCDSYLTQGLACLIESSPSLVILNSISIAKSRVCESDGYRRSNLL